MSEPENPEALTQYLDRALHVPADDRRAFEAGDWVAFIRTRLPPPAAWRIVRRAAWQRAVDFAANSATRSNTTELHLVPVWVCDNVDGEAESSDWVCLSLLIVDFQPPLPLDPRWSRDSVLTARVRSFDAPYVVESTVYAPGIELPYRNRHFAVVRSGRILELVDAPKAQVVGRLPAPSARVGPFLLGVEPAVELDGLDEVSRASIERAVRHLDSRRDES